MGPTVSEPGRNEGFFPTDPETGDGVPSSITNVGSTCRFRTRRSCSSWDSNSELYTHVSGGVVGDKDPSLRVCPKDPTDPRQPLCLSPRRWSNRGRTTGPSVGSSGERG